MTAQNRYLIIRFAVVYLLAMGLVAVIVLLLQRFISLNAGSGLGVVAVLAAAMDAGQTYAKRNKALPQSRYAWKMSVVFTVVTIVLSFALALMLPEIRIMINEMGGVFAGIAVVFAAIYFLAIRFFFMSGAKNTMKAIKPK